MMTRNSSRTLSRYLFRELVTIFGMSLLALSLLFLLVFGIKAVQGGYSLGIIAPWMLESLIYSFFFTVPLSLMVASTLGYGRFVADREYTAAIASGISPLSIARPMVLLSGVLCLVAMLTQGTVLPHAHYKQRNITRYLVKQLEHLGDSKRGKLRIDKADGIVHWDEIRDGRHLRGVSIDKRIPLGNLTPQTMAGNRIVEIENADPEAPTPPTMITAERATLDVDDEQEAILFTLSQVQVTLPQPQQGWLFPEAGVVKFDRLFEIVEVSLSFPINEKAKREGDWTNRELYRKVDEYRVRAEELRVEVARLSEHAPPEGIDRPLTEDEKAYVKAANELEWFERRVPKSLGEIWHRRALALSVLTFGLLGFPIAVSFRHRHKMVPFFVGILLVVAVYYPLLLLGESLVKNFGLPASLSMLAGNIVLLLYGLFLTGRMMSR